MITHGKLGGESFEITTHGDDYLMFSSHVFTLPAELVTGLSRLTYWKPQFLESVRDALSPFQIQSKSWAASCLFDFLKNSAKFEAVAYYGSWFGQQSSILSRGNRLAMLGCSSFLVDKDPEVCEAVESLLEWDSYHKSSGIEVVCSETKDFKFPNPRGRNLVVWNGCEHFEAQELRDFLNNFPSTAVCMQNTDIEAEGHVSTVDSVEAWINDVVPDDRRADILYSGTLHMEGKSRFMILVDSKTPRN